MKNNQSLKTYFKNSDLHGEELQNFKERIDGIFQEREEDKVQNQKIIDDANKRIYELEYNNEVLKKNYEDLLKKVDGEDQVTVVQPNQPNANVNEKEVNLQSEKTSMKDMVKGVIQGLKFTNEKVKKLSVIQETFGNDTLMKLKKDLACKIISLLTT